MTVEQLGFGDMPRRLFPCTPSKLAAYSDCPRRYRFTYLERPSPPKGPPWAHNSMGAAVHSALRAWWDLPLARRTPEAARSLVHSLWLQEGWRDDVQSAEWRERAAAFTEQYVATLDPADEPVGVERHVATTTPSLALSGRVDRLDDRDGDLVVVDYKTGRRRLTTDDARSSVALAVYAVAAARTLRRPCTRVELHHLPSGEVIAWEHTDESLQRHLRRLESVASDIEAATGRVDAGDSRDSAFPPAPGPVCGFCDFRSVCPEGQSAAPAAASWAAVEDR